MKQLLLVGIALCFIFPVDGPVIRDFEQRFSWGYHTGVDWFVPYGTPVMAAADGVVVYADRLAWGADRGVIVLAHDLPSGHVVYTFYGHVDPITEGLTIGQQVRVGQVIGAVGRPAPPASTHLHFEMRDEWAGLTGGYWDYPPSESGWIAPALFVGHCILEVENVRVRCPAGAE